jgi:anaerobic selenocysteine-containing dehydrogenase
MPAVAVRNHVRYNRAAIPKPDDGREDWQILNGITQRLRGWPLGRPTATAAKLGARLASPERVIDAGLTLGPYGLRRGPFRALSVRKLKRAEHGIDLGPLQPRLPDALQTPGRRLRLAPPVLLEEGKRLDQLAADREASLSDGYDLVLVGRRQLRSNNSWMHNSKRLMKGPDRCTALLHPEDARARGLADGERVRVVSRVGVIELPLQVSDEIRRGVVSIPHGFGHDRPGVGWTVAAAHGGASVNDITDPSVVDRVTGNAAMNAVPVHVEAAS